MKLSSSHFYFKSKIPFHFPFSHKPKCPPINTISATAFSSKSRRDDKAVVIMGATGCGKSGLSIQLASRYAGEIINSDKIQVYKGLDITTNKIPFHQRNNIPHHILGEIESLSEEFSPLDFRILAQNKISNITSRKNVPFIVGGSNSFIHALLVNKFNPNIDVFNDSRLVNSSDLRYRCCFLWVDVSFPVLSDYLSIRVDEMLEMGMVEELAEFYNPKEVGKLKGIRKAIGVPEFDPYFEKYWAGKNIVLTKNNQYEKAVNAIKENTNLLAKKQIEKIMKLKKNGWDLNILDATEVVKVVVDSGSEKKRSEIWNKKVLEPSMEIVKRFLEK